MPGSMPVKRSASLTKRISSSLEHQQAGTPIAERNLGQIDMVAKQIEIKRGLHKGFPNRLY